MDLDHNYFKHMDITKKKKMMPRSLSVKTLGVKQLDFQSHSENPVSIKIVFKYQGILEE